MRHTHALMLSFVLVATFSSAASEPAKSAEPATANTSAKPAVAKPARSSAEILAASAPGDWRDLPLDATFVMEIPSGPVVIELATEFAPHHADSIRRLVKAGYFDGLAIIREQDNYVSQWGDPAEGDARAKAKPVDMPKVPAEFDRALEGLKFTKLREQDSWAPQVGFVDGWPVGVDPKRGRAWLTHCYGMVGAARGEAVDSSDGSSLYAMIGPARGLDRNITTVGRVVQGIERLSSLPRGTGTLGFYEKPEQYTPIARARMLADIPAAERPKLQVLRTGTPTWQKWLDSRRHRGGWFVHDPAHVDLCGVLPPVRTTP